MTNKNLSVVSDNTENTVVCEYKRIIDSATAYQNEEALEKEFVDLLCSQGYERLKIKTESNLILNLRKQIEDLNNFKFVDSEWNRFFSTKIVNGNDGLIEKTKKIQEESSQDFILDNGELKNIILINKKDIHKNKLQVLNQFENNEGTYKNRYDVTVLVNGLPLVHVELKRRGVDIREAFNQIDRYKRDSFWAGSGLYEYIQVFVISNGTITKYYSNTTRDSHLNSSNRKKSNTFEFTSFWADAKNKVIFDLMGFGKTFFAKHTILNILTKYCVFTSEQRLLVMRPYQIVATEKIINKINISHNKKEFGSNRSGGYVWHTTGSGKTLTSFKTAQLAKKLEFISKVLFVVDRKDLDYQTMKEYDRFQKGCANSNTSTTVLAKQLGDTNTKIIITTIQKLDKFIKKNKNHELYNKEVVMIFDECHRSQFGDMHKNIIKNFNKFYIFGFTGTPIWAVNAPKNIPNFTTKEVFGDELHTYTIVDAIKDKNVLPFKVDFISVVKEKDNIKDKKVLAIDKEKLFLADEYITKVSNYVIDHYAQKTKHNESYVFNKLINIKELAKNNKLDEIREKTNLCGFNSIFACSSVESAKLYYSKFKELGSNLKIALIYSYSANEEEVDGIENENNEDTNGLDNNSRDFLEKAIADYNKMFNTTWDISADKFQSYYKDLSMRMKNREIDMLIVVNMFLTGFDATTLNTLWVDKNLKYHGLIQAFSRTNRILNSVKTFGNVICFRNLEERLNEALKLFGETENKSVVLLKKFEDYYFGYEDDDTIFEGYKAIVETLKSEHPIDEKIFGEKAEKAFINLYGKLLKVINILNCFDQFVGRELLNPREMQDYHSIYIDLYNKYKGRNTADKENIAEDVVFEIELIKQIEVNIDYILGLIKNYVDSKCEDKEILINITKCIDSSIELSNKKDLIMAFISSLNSGSNVYKDFATYMEKQRILELDKIIAEENLNKEETYEYVKRAFKYGGINTLGVEITKVLPPMSRFSKTDERTIKKNIIIGKLLEFYDIFYTISSEDFDI